MAELLLCRDGFERALEREIAWRGGVVLDSRPCHIMADKIDSACYSGFCYATHILVDPVEVRGDGLNPFVDQLLDVFLKGMAGRKIESAWPLLFAAAADERVLRHRVHIEQMWKEQLKKRMSRLVRLADEGEQFGGGRYRGYLAYISGFRQAWVALDFVSGGQRRMQMDDRAPSRSYLKLEEAWKVAGRYPESGDSVVDLGAAPGGWSWSALKRGAEVTAVDNGPLRAPVEGHPGLTHFREDALRFSPGIPCGWLLCDVLESPEVIIGLLGRWLERGWCRDFVVNLKLGFREPVSILKLCEAQIHPLCRELTVRHLYHDRDEITLIGRNRKFRN